MRKGEASAEGTGDAAQRDVGGIAQGDVGGELEPAVASHTVGVRALALFGDAWETIPKPNVTSALAMLLNEMWEATLKKTWEMNWSPPPPATTLGSELWHCSGAHGSKS